VKEKKKRRTEKKGYKRLKTISKWVKITTFGI